jgi:hypothetical protein
MARSAEIEAFVSRYSDEIAAQLRRARAELRMLIPNGYELVYESHNALIFAFGPTPKASELVISIAGYPKWVTLLFAKGTALEDPSGLLEGSGPAIRSVRLDPFEALKSQPVQALVKRALAAQAATFKRAPPLTTVVKAISPKQRSRRPE